MSGGASLPLLSEPEASPTPEVETEPEAAAPAESSDLLQGVDALRDDLAARGDNIGRIINWLDAVGFDVADTRFSLWSALVVVLVLVGVYMLARLGEKAGRTILRRFHSLDPSRIVLADKLVSVVVWTRDPDRDRPPRP